MKRLLVSLAIGVFLLSACGTDAEEGTDIEAHDAWARSAFKNENSAVYLLMHNHSGNADEITGVSSDIAETAEIHKTEVGADGIMRMTLQTSVSLPVDAEISFAPGGLHIMLSGLKKDLNVGDEIALTLHFKTHADIPLSVPVLDAANPDHSNMDMEMDASPTP